MALSSKIKTAFFCSNCGFESSKWVGKCTSCQQWNTMVEEVLSKGPAKAAPWESTHNTLPNKPVILDDIPIIDEARILLTDPELSRVLGGGIVPGSVILMAGEPGIGKSTLLLQNCMQERDRRVLYVSGEESIQQIKLRAQRLGAKHPEFYVLGATDTNSILTEMAKLQPSWAVIDSIQTLESAVLESPAGSVGQIRQCTAELIKYAKTYNTTLFLIGHVTKDGQVAGPKVLEHMVDTVLQFEGDRHYAYRMLRTLKNRFGSTNELGIYEMIEAGMRPVTNPSEMLLNQKDATLSGSSIACIIEGVRPLLVELQALVAPSVYGTPQRTVTGFDLRRLQLLLAVLDKRGGFQFGARDVFVSVAGGLRIEDPATDLAVIMALLSSYEDIALPMTACFAGEVGLNGEIRTVSRVEQRIAEAARLGFEKIFVSKHTNLTGKNYGIEIFKVGGVEEVYKMLF